MTSITKITSSVTTEFNINKNLAALLLRLASLGKDEIFNPKSMSMPVRNILVQPQDKSMKSFLDLVNECDNFCSKDRDPRRYAKVTATYYTLHLQGAEGMAGPFGFLPRWVVERMPWGTDWKIDPLNMQIMPVVEPAQLSSQPETIQRTLMRARRGKCFQVLDGWRNEMYPVAGHRSVAMERAGSALFGINTYGVHMTVYTVIDGKTKIWVPRRARDKQTYGGMLDNTVAGGLTAGEHPFDCLLREATEEASLQEDLVRRNAKPCGTVSYFHLRDCRAGGESDLCQPECQYVYDMAVERDVQPKPNDSEVEEFFLCSIDDIESRLSNSEFKPNCALVLLDFLVRHSFLTADNEPCYTEIATRLHRALPFPSHAPE